MFLEASILGIPIFPCTTPPPPAAHTPHTHLLIFVPQARAGAEHLHVSAALGVLGLLPVARGFVGADVLLAGLPVGHLALPGALGPTQTDADGWRKPSCFSAAFRNPGFGFDSPVNTTKRQPWCPSGANGCSPSKVWFRRCPVCEEGKEGSNSWLPRMKTRGNSSTNV